MRNDGKRPMDTSRAHTHRHRPERTPAGSRASRHARLAEKSARGTLAWDAPRKTSYIDRMKSTPYPLFPPPQLLFFVWLFPSFLFFVGLLCSSQVCHASFSISFNLVLSASLRESVSVYCLVFPSVHCLFFPWEIRVVPTAPLSTPL